MRDMSIGPHEGVARPPKKRKRTLKERARHMQNTNNSKGMAEVTLPKEPWKEEGGKDGQPR